MSQHTQVIETIIKNMLRMKQGIQAGGVLLTGDPGLGKTTLVEMMASMLGIKSIIIEVPHITEEHLINIPFLVYNPQTNTTQSMKSQESDGEYKMVLAQSNLFTQITKAQAMSDQEYLQHIQQAPAHVQAAYQQLGGTPDVIPPLIRSVRSKFNCILFLDEFYRQTSMRIRNILRGILNKRIGMHQLPADTYVVYASNMKDAGLDEIPSNHQFQSVSFRAPKSADWFAWFIGKYKNNTEVNLNPAVIEKFAKLLTDGDISYMDVNTEVRTSPRRWEQLLLYINSALPVDSDQDAKSLLTNVKHNFINYLSKQHSNLADKILPAVKELIKETSNMDVNATNEEHEWRETLEHQVKMQMKLGEHKRHIPVISGDPGIGKAQSLRSKVLTPNGWKIMGDMTTDDMVVTPQGDHAKVNGVYPQGEREMYRVTFSDGRYTEADGEHLWKVRKERANKWQIITTNDISAHLQQYKRGFYIPLVTHTSPDMLLPMDPYMLGALLGDGCFTNDCILISSADDHILNRVSETLDPSYSIKHSGQYDYRITLNDRPVSQRVPNDQRTGTNQYKNIIRALGLLGTHSSTKFIPDVFKQGSKKQKEQLLAGLIDTDGHVTKSGAISFTTISPELAADVAEIVRSIGGIATTRSRVPTYTYKGTKKEGQLAYTVSIRYPEPHNIVSLPRKLERVSKDYQYKNLQLKITSVESIGMMPAQCIMIDHPEHLYITDDYIVTHNTTAAWQIAKKHDLRLIDIDVSEIYADDASGLPVPGGSQEERSTGRMSIRFSAPKLFQQIEMQIKEADAKHIEFLQQRFGEQAEEKIKEYQQRKYKYLILFDEINRVDEKTFNALRKVILEKNFGPKGDNSGEYLKLPKEAIVIAAMNPEGVGTSELTSHFRDVIDVIPAKATWSKTKQFLESRNIQSIDDSDISQPFKDAALSLLSLFVEKFKSKSNNIPMEQRPFLLDLGSAEVYVSPREYNDMFVQLVQDMDYEFSKLDDNATTEQVKNAIDDPIADAFEQGLNHPLVKAGVDGEEFLLLIRNWIQSIPPKQYGSLLTKMANNAGGLTTSIKSWLDKIDVTTMPDDLDMVNAHNAVNNAQVIDQVREALQSKIIDEETLRKYVITEHAAKVEFDGNDIKQTGEKVPHMTNFILAMLYTLRIHSFSNDRVSIIGKALSVSMRELLASLSRTGRITRNTALEAMEQIAALRTDIMEFVESLQTEYK